MKIQHLIPILFLAVFCTGCSQTIITAPAGTTNTISSTTSYIVADGSEYIAFFPMMRPTSPPLSVPIHTITATPTNGPTTVTLRARTKDGKLPLDANYINFRRVDQPQDLPPQMLSFVGTGGDWTATKAPPGSYGVVLENTNYVEGERDFQTLSIEAGTNYIIDFVLSNGATFTGRILDATTGKPIAGADVRGNTGTRFHSVRTDAEGRYEISHVTGGLKINASDPNHVTQIFKLDAAGEDSTVSVPDIRLQRGGRISGRVERPADMEDNARAFVSVEIQGRFPTNSDICGAYGEADGTFRTGPLPPGIATLHASWEPAFVSGNAVATWQSIGTVSNINVTAGKNTTKVVIPASRH